MAVEVPTREFGPAMMALTEMQRRFVVEWLAGECKDAAAAARRAGYSDVADGAKVTACRLLQGAKVQAALREEAERHLVLLVPLALMKLKRQFNSKNEKVVGKAIENVLDRTGFGRSTSQDIRVEHVDKRTTADLMQVVRQFAGTALPAPVEGQFKEVAPGADPTDRG